MNRLLCVAFIMMFTCTVNALPTMLNYQGTIEGDSAAIGETGYFKFALVNSDGTVTYWSNDGTSVGGAEPADAVTVAISQGLYTVRLGDSTVTHMSAIDHSVFENDSVYLRIWFDDGSTGSQLLTPDQPITSVGYAMKAAVAESAVSATVADDADTVDGMEGAELEESSEIDADIASHAAIADAHHSKTTSFTELSDSANDSQIPNNITIDYATESGDAETLDGLDSTAFGDGHSLDAADGNPVDVVSVSNTGNVGINTSMSPDETLYVNGTAQVGSPGSGGEGSSQASSSWGGDGYLETPWIYANAIEASDERGSGGTLITVGTSNYTSEDEIALVTGGTARVKIQDDGAVVIGTAASIGLDQDQSDIMPPGGSPSDGWQSFTPSISGFLRRIQLRMNDVGTFSFTLRIREGQGTSGSVLAEETMSFTTGNSWETHVFEAPAYLLANQLYTMEFYGVSNWIRMNHEDPYPHGESQNPYADYAFRTYMSELDRVINVNTGGSLDIDASATVKLKGDGDVGIGTVNPAARLEIYDSTLGPVMHVHNPRNTFVSNGIDVTAGANAYFAPSSFLTFRTPNGNTIGNINQTGTSSVNYYSVSDMRLQKEVHTTDHTIADLMNISVVDYADINDPDRVQTGCNAKHLHKVFPEAVAPGGDDPEETPWMIDYGRLTPLLVKAIQDQQFIIADQEEKIESLQNVILDLTLRLETLENTVVP